MLENIIIQKADKSNVIVLINKNYYVRNIQKADKSNVIVLINKSYYADRNVISLLNYKKRIRVT